MPVELPARPAEATEHAPELIVEDAAPSRVEWRGQVVLEGLYEGGGFREAVTARVGDPPDDRGARLAGLGMASVAVLAAATHDLGGEGESGLASGLVNTTQQVGGAVGLAVLSTLTFSRSDDLLAAGAAFPVALLHGLVLAMRVGAGIALTGAVLAALALTRAARRPTPAAAVPAPGVPPRTS